MHDCKTRQLMRERTANGGLRLRLFPNIRYGTEGYPENVARRLRTINIAAWLAALVPAFFAVLRLSMGLPGRALIDAAQALLIASIPLLHRFGAYVAPIALVLVTYALLFRVTSQVGTDGGSYFYYLSAGAVGILVLGTERVLLAFVLGGLGIGLIVVLHLVVPHNTGMFSPDVLFYGNFVTNVIASSAIVFAIMYYAVREIARSEATAQREYERSESLLANILPNAVAARLKSKQAVIADRYDDASILFADMAGFTERASAIAPDELVQFLNRVFTGFDRLVETHGLEKIKTTGDAYMVASGVPAPRPDHMQALARLALDMRDMAVNLRDPRGHNVPVRIGLATGPVVAGVVGTRKFFYDVWGDAVNLASRMESTGVAGKIQVPEDVYDRLKSEFVFEERGPIEVKGKGTLRTWFLLRAER